ACCTGNTSSRSICFQTALATATARTSVVTTHDHVTQFTCKSVMSVNQVTADYDTATNTGSQCDHDKVFHTAGSAIRHFTDSSRIRVVCQCYGHTTQFFADQLR